MKAAMKRLSEQLWYTHKSQRAEIIALQVVSRERQSTDAELEPSVADRSESAFSNLQQLGVSLQEGQPSAWLFQSLSKANNLELLHMDLVSLQPLPLLNSLKHLLLNIKTVENLGKGFCNAIGEFTCLQTLGMGRELSSTAGSDLSIIRRAMCSCLL